MSRPYGDRDRDRYGYGGRNEEPHTLIPNPSRWKSYGSNIKIRNAARKAENEATAPAREDEARRLAFYREGVRARGDAASEVRAGFDYYRPEAIARRNGIRAGVIHSTAGVRDYLYEDFQRDFENVLKEDAFIEYKRKYDEFKMNRPIAYKNVMNEFKYILNYEEPNKDIAYQYLMQHIGALNDATGDRTFYENLKSLEGGGRRKPRAKRTHKRRRTHSKKRRSTHKRRRN
jgi:hypothetical protein